MTSHRDRKWVAGSRHDNCVKWEHFGMTSRAEPRVPRGPPRCARNRTIGGGESFPVDGHMHDDALARLRHAEESDHQVAPPFAHSFSVGRWMMASDGREKLLTFFRIRRQRLKNW